jgi:hypothetical protein
MTAEAVANVPFYKRLAAQLRALDAFWYFGADDDPHFVGYRVAPGVAIHNIRKSSPPDELHAHPWPYSSVVLEGQYLDIAESGIAVVRCVGAFTQHPEVYRHRVEVPEGGDCWTWSLHGPS